MKVKRTERGWGAHFCASSMCRFRRNTLLESDSGERIIVSTVGAMRDPDGNVCEIGCERHYETMVFKAKFDGTYWDADFSEHVEFESNWRIDVVNQSSDQLANEMHEDVVKEMAERLTKEASEPREVGE